MTIAADLTDLPQPPDTYFSTYLLRSWLITTDHKRIAALYLILVTLMFSLGGFAAFLTRMQLMTPSGLVVNAEVYNELVTMHGIVTIFFFLIPSVFAAIGSFVLPMMLGATNLAFPRLNLLCWYLFLLGASCTVGAMASSGVDAGWTSYTPLNTGLYSSRHVIATVIGVLIAEFALILMAINFIVTIHTKRAPGLSWTRLPLFCWALYAASLIFIFLLGTAFVALPLTWAGLGRIFQTGLFDQRYSGDPILFHHLFWFYTHPVVYLLILPAMGAVSEIVACFARKRVFGYGCVALCFLTISVLGLFVWGHHMFLATASISSDMTLSILSFLIAIPAMVILFNWIATLHGGAISFATPMLYALGFIGLFTIACASGLMLATLGAYLHLHETYFIIAHMHYTLVGAGVMGYLGAVHYWWPKITGRLFPDMWGRASAFIIFIAFNLTFFPQFILGYLGLPRRYYIYPPDFQVYNVMSSSGASLLAVGFLLPLGYLIWSLKYGRVAEPNPWRATGLEWQTPSPPPSCNFSETPVVTAETYSYSPEQSESV